MQKKVITALIAFILSLSGCVSSEEKPLTHPNHSTYEIDLSSPDITKKLKAGTLKIWYIAKGTRSEGLHGVLEGIEIEEKKRGMVIESSIGPLTFFGEWNEREHSFSVSGWLPSDTGTIYPSWKHIQSERDNG